MRKSTAAFAIAFVILAISIVIVFEYRFVRYNGFVRLTFDISLIPYTYDYGTAVLDTMDISLSRSQLNTGSNQTTKTLSFPYGKLLRPLNMSLNLTLQSNNNIITLPTGNITFPEEGKYAFVYFHSLTDIESGTYLVKLTYTEFFRESFVNWESVEFYLTLE